MKIKIEPHNKEWPIQFLKLKNEILSILKPFDPIVEHFGSTAVPGLPSKPVIDILVGIKDQSQFSSIVNVMLEHPSYIYYKAFDIAIPNRRLFVRLKDNVDPKDFNNVINDLMSIPHDKINDSRIAHIHIWEYNSPDWIRHIAFRDYLIAHEDVREEYGQLKMKLSKQDWINGMEYNDAKNSYIKELERKAISWYKKKK